jgi:hypothetical protein
VASSSSGSETVIRNARIVPLASEGSGEEVPHAIEERLLLVGDVGNRKGLGELLHERALLRVEAGRDDHPDENVEVSPPPSAELGHALASKAEDAAGLGALGDGQLRLVTAEHGNLQGGTEGGLGKADRDLAEEMGAVAPEELVVRDPEDDVEVAGGATLGSPLALAGDPELGAVVDAGGNLDLERALGLDLALAVARLALLGDDAPGAAAVAARAGDAEEALLERDLPRASAGGAGGRPGAGSGPRARAGLAGLTPGDADLGLRSERRLLERDLEVVAEIGAAKIVGSNPAPPAPPSPACPKASYRRLFSGSPRTP